MPSSASLHGKTRPHKTSGFLSSEETPRGGREWQRGWNGINYMQERERGTPGRAGHVAEPASSQVTISLVDGHFPDPQVVWQRVSRPRQHKAAAAGPAAPVLLAPQQHVGLQLAQLGSRLLRLALRGGVGRWAVWAGCVWGRGGDDDVMPWGLCTMHQQGARTHACVEPGNLPAVPISMPNRYQPLRRSPLPPAPGSCSAAAAPRCRWASTQAPLHQAGFGGCRSATAPQSMHAGTWFTS